MDASFGFSWNLLADCVGDRNSCRLEASAQHDQQVATAEASGKISTHCRIAKAVF